MNKLIQELKIDTPRRKKMIEEARCKGKCDTTDGECEDCYQDFTNSREEDYGL